MPNAHLDVKDRNRQAVTAAFWRKLAGYEVFISDAVLEELGATGSGERRNELLALVRMFRSVPSNNEEVMFLAAEYVNRGIIPARHFVDAIHLAAASCASIDILVSWNFEHLVKLKTKREVNLLNALLGYGQLEIVEPGML